MKFLILHVFIFGLMIEVSAQNSPISSIAYYVETLAADSMEGRKPGTEGIEKAAGFIADQYRNIGLLPYKSSTYFQSVYLNRGLFYNTSKIEIDDETFTYNEQFDIYTVPSAAKVISFENIIFAGYGLKDSSARIDDYKGLSVKGKMVIVQDGIPEKYAKQLPYYDVNRKIEAAKSAGASGLIVLSKEKPAGKSVEKRRRVSELFDPYDSGNFTCVVLRNGERVEKLLKSPSFKSITFTFDTEPLTGRNIIGIIPGTDPILKNEWIVVTAHYDHIGKLSYHEKGKDGIFNGALDNASGTAGLISIADRFIRSGKKQKRSIMFLALTAEEMGFFGSQSFIKSSLIPRNSIIANINLDILGFDPRNLSDTYITLLGGEYSTLGDMFENHAEKNNVLIMPNYLPSFFYRSDNITFARAGIPSIQPAFGMKPSFALDDMTTFEKYYHQPGDEIPNVPISYSLIYRQTEVVVSVLKELADTNQKPQWKKGLSTLESEKKWDYAGMARLWIRKWFW